MIPEQEANFDKGAVLFLVLSSVSGAVFTWCTFWAYKFVDLDDI